MKSFLLILSLAFFIASCNNTATTAPSTDGLAASINYTDKVINKVVFDGEKYKLILFAIAKDQVLPAHAAPMDAPLLMLEGSATISIGDKEHVVKAGEMITLPKDIDHGVFPITDCKFLLAK